MDFTKTMNTNDAIKKIGNKPIKKIVVKVDKDGDAWWLYSDDEWKNYVTDDFNQKFVIFGNSSFNKITEARWWRNMTEIIHDLEYYGKESLKYYKSYTTREQRVKIAKLYDEVESGKRYVNRRQAYLDDTEIMIEMLNILYPEKEFVEDTIRGYSQGDWQTVIHPKDVPIDRLEDFYFGNVTELWFEDGDDQCTDVLPDSVLWEMERDGSIEQYIREGYPKDFVFDIEYTDSDGDVQLFEYKKGE